MISTNSQISWSDPLIGLLNNLLSEIPDTRHSLREYTRKYYITALCANNSPRVIDLEHFIESFLALLSNQVPSLWPPVARLAKVLDFCRVLISMSWTMSWLCWCWHGVWTDVVTVPAGGPLITASRLFTAWLTLSCSPHSSHSPGDQSEGPGYQISGDGVPSAGTCWGSAVLQQTDGEGHSSTNFLAFSQSTSQSDVRGQRQPPSDLSARNCVSEWLSLYRSSQLSWGSTEKPPRRAAENRFWGKAGVYTLGTHSGDILSIMTSVRSCLPGQGRDVGLLVCSLCKCNMLQRLSCFTSPSPPLSSPLLPSPAQLCSTEHMLAATLHPALNGFNTMNNQRRSRHLSPLCRGKDIEVRAV